MNDVHTMAREALKRALTPDFIGFVYEDGRAGEEHLSDAVERALDSIQRLLSVQEVSQKRLGATVMTVDASFRNGKDGLPGIAPRNL
tara:strand:- start:241 stop:501 length:261 start_codon:yes stop_codon:yes gene_type:complete